MNSDRGTAPGASFANGNGPGGAILAVLPASHWAVLSGAVADPFWR